MDGGRSDISERKNEPEQQDESDNDQRDSSETRVGTKRDVETEENEEIERGNSGYRNYMTMQLKGKGLQLLHFIEGQDDKMVNYDRKTGSLILYGKKESETLLPLLEDATSNDGKLK